MKNPTAGPWFASPFSSVVGVAITAQPDPKQNTVVVATAFTEADGALVAAAPALLDALEKMLPILERAGRHYGLRDLDELLTLGRDAVFKARTMR